MAVLGLLSLASAPDFAIAGAWTQPKGHIYGRVSYAAITTVHRFDAEGNQTGLEAPNLPQRGTEYRGREVRLYGELGVRERFSVYGSSALKRVRILEPSFGSGSGSLPEAIHETTGIGDLNLGGRLRVLGGSRPVSIAGEIKIPTGYSTRSNPSLGNGYVDATIRALVGASAGWIYATSDLGWTHRWGPYQDEALFSFEVGGRIARYYSVRGVVRGVRSVGRTTASFDNSAFDPALASPRSLAFEVVIGDEIVSGLDIEAGLSHVHSGRNTLAGNTFEVGLAWSIQAGRK